MTAARGGEQSRQGREPTGAGRLLGRRSAISLLVAAIWCIGLIVAAATLPAYSSTTTTAGGAGSSEVSTTSTETLLEVNGVGVLVVVGLPLVAVGAVATMLALRRRRRRSGAGPVAWTAVGLLAALAILGIMSIGVFIMPAVVLLAIACAAASPPSRAT